jgi:hypothetical protein
MTLLTEIGPLDEVLLAHADELGDDFVAYRNHAYRVANLCVALAPDGRDQLEKIGIAAALHDVGIWTDRTFDYLEPSVAVANAYLVRIGRRGWMPEIAAMIREHHKVSAYRANAGSLVEPFRRADWIDVSKGVLAFGTPRTLVKEVLATWPSAGFHWRLVQLAGRRVRTHPWSPLPMLRL